MVKKTLMILDQDFNLPKSIYTLLIFVFRDTMTQYNIKNAFTIGKTIKKICATLILITIITTTLTSLSAQTQVTTQTQLTSKQTTNKSNRKPDLTIEKLYGDDYCLDWCNPYICCTIKNKGKTAVPKNTKITVKFSYIRQWPTIKKFTEERNFTTGLASNKKKTVSIFPRVRNGIVFTHAVVDPHDTIHEEKEWNNRAANIIVFLLGTTIFYFGMLQEQEISSCVGTSQDKLPMEDSTEKQNESPENDISELFITGWVHGTYTNHEKNDGIHHWKSDSCSVLVTGFGWFYTYHGPEFGFSTTCGRHVTATKFIGLCHNGRVQGIGVNLKVSHNQNRE